MRALFLASLLALAPGCGQYPEVIEAERTSTAPQEPPPLAPLGDLLARAGTPDVSADTTAAVEARAAALRRRAEGLR